MREDLINSELLATQLPRLKYDVGPNFHGSALSVWYSRRGRALAYLAELGGHVPNFYRRKEIGITLNGNTFGRARVHV